MDFKTRPTKIATMATEDSSAEKRRKLENGHSTTDSTDRVDRLASMLRRSLESIGNRHHHPAPPFTDDYDDHHVRRMARLIETSMTTPGRVYHDVDHVFDVSRSMKIPADSIAVLAALFHDVIYLTVDKELSIEQQEILNDIVDDPHDRVSLHYKIPFHDPLVQMTRAMFDYVLGPTPKPNVRMDETNEFLSALIAVKMLGDTLSKKHIFRIIACIEASIPFRPILDGKTPMDSLHHLLVRVNADHDVGLSATELVETVQEAAFFANNDLISFRSHHRVFLDNTWKLLPEWTPHLLSPTCKLQQVFQALANLMERYKHVPTQRIFQSFQDKPSKSEIAAMQAKATKNMGVVGTYIRVRVFAIRCLLDLLTLAFVHDYETMLIQHTGGATALFRQVEQGVDARHDKFQPSDPVEECLTAKRSASVHRHWDAEETLWSATVYRDVPWEDIESSGDKMVGSGDLLRLLPSDVRNALADAVAQALPEQYEKDIRQVTSTVSGDCE